ncbi:MAG: four helix bundle protein [Flavobacteriales bacterium]|nr:four helix bundle protein [Flavobacteriales bacterium]
MGTFEELEVYQRATVFRRKISAIAKRLPVEEKFRLRDQIIRSSRSVTAQIAEGHGRYHYQENIRFCRISRGSLDETHDHLTVALEEGYIDETEYSQLIAEKALIMKMLNGYIRYLRKSKRGE